MDVKDVRLAIAQEIDRRKLNQTEVADRARMTQGHLSNVLNVDGLEMRDLSARVLFQLITDGLGVPLSKFFAGLEGEAAGHEIGPPEFANPEGVGHEAREAPARDRQAVETDPALIQAFKDLATYAKELRDDRERWIAAYETLKERAETIDRQRADARLSASEHAPTRQSRGRRTPARVPTQRRRPPKRK